MYFILAKATLCLDDSFAHSWHSLSQLHEVVTWNAFQLTCVPCSIHVCNSFPQCVCDNQLCCEKVGLSSVFYPYLVKDQVQIIARTAQISKEK